MTHLICMCKLSVHPEVKLLKRPHADDKEKSETTKDLGKMLYRIWTLLFIGLVSEALQINPSKFTISGVEFIIQNGRFVAGIIYSLIVIMYCVLFVGLIMQEINYGRSRFPMMKGLIYISSGKSKTLINASRSGIVSIKIVSRFIAKVFIWIAIFTVFTPLLLILFFKAGAVYSALRLILFHY